MAEDQTTKVRNPRGPSLHTVQRAEELLKAITENPGGTVGEYARILGRDTRYVSPGLTHLAKSGKIVHVHFDSAHRYYLTGSSPYDTVTSVQDTEIS